MFLMLIHVCLMSFLDSTHCLFHYWDFALRITLFIKFLYCLYCWSIL